MNPTRLTTTPRALRSVRIEGQLWRAALATYGRRGISEAIRVALEKGVAENLNNRRFPETALLDWPTAQGGVGLDPVTLIVWSVLPDGRDKTGTNTGKECAEFRAYARNGRTRTGWAAEPEAFFIGIDELAELLRKHPKSFEAHMPSGYAGEAEDLPW